MKKHRIFNTGDTIYCLLSSYTTPNVLLPVKGLIIDTKWDPINPKYKIRILKFYDTIQYLKKYFFNMRFHKSFDSRSSFINLNEKDYPNVQTLEERLNDKDREKFFVIVDSLMAKKTKVKLKDLFIKVQFYLISKNIKQNKEFMSRSLFDGPLKVSGRFEYNKRFKKGWSDKFNKDDLDIDKYLDSLD